MPDPAHPCSVRPGRDRAISVYLILFKVWANEASYGWKTGRKTARDEPQLLESLLIKLLSDCTLPTQAQEEKKIPL
jgi:hypothetical protein